MPRGPVVEAFYDLALLSWGHTMTPPLPLLSEPAPKPTRYLFGREHPQIAVKDLEQSRLQAPQILSSGDVSVSATSVQPPNTGEHPAARDQNDIGTAQAPETGRSNDGGGKDVQKSLEENFSTMKLVTAHLSECSFHRSTRMAVLSSVDVFRHEYPA